MKKTLFLAVALMMSAASFAQTANVKKAKGLVGSLSPESTEASTANFAQAYSLIEEAIANPETANDANTYFVAGLVGYKECEMISLNPMYKQAANDDMQGHAALFCFENWLKADQMSTVPFLDKKGNEKVDLKIRKQIVPKMLEFYQRQDLIVYGVYLNGKQDYEGAYKAFNYYLQIPDLEMFTEKEKVKMPKDSTYAQYKYYAALFAIQAKMHEQAIPLLEEIKDGEYEPMTCAQFLYQEYVDTQDTVNFLRVLKESIVKFPGEPWFLQNLINYYIFSKQEGEAINYLNQAIEMEPNVAQYYLIRGNLHENASNFDAAMADFATALEKDPTMADAEAGKGRVYYNQAVKINEEAAYLDGKEYQKALKSMNDLFQQSLPYFEKAHEMAPESREYMITLRTLYYRFEMNDKYEAIQKEIDNL